MIGRASSVAMPNRIRPTPKITDWAMNACIRGAGGSPASKLGAVRASHAAAKLVKGAPAAKTVKG